MQLAILNAMEDRTSRCRTRSCGGGRKRRFKRAERDEQGASEMREQAVLTSALLAVRDGALIAAGPETAGWRSVRRDLRATTMQCTVLSDSAQQWR